MIMMSDKTWKLCQRHGGIWSEHLEHPLKTWVLECRNNITRTGYWDWVIIRIERKTKEAQR